MNKHTHFAMVTTTTAVAIDDPAKSAGHAADQWRCVHVVNEIVVRRAHFIFLSTTAMVYDQSTLAVFLYSDQVLCMYVRTSQYGQ